MIRCCETSHVAGVGRHRGWVKAVAPSTQQREGLRERGAAHRLRNHFGGVWVQHSLTSPLWERAKAHVCALRFYLIDGCNRYRGPRRRTHSHLVPEA